MTRNVKLHYFSWNYHASNSLMQCTAFHLLNEDMSQRLNRAVCTVNSMRYLWKCQWFSVCGSLRVLDTMMWMKVKHLGWTVYIAAVRCSAFVSPTMIKGLATMYELASMKQANLTVSQTFSNALHEGLLTSCSCGILVSVCSAKRLSSSMCLISVIMSSTLTPLCYL